MTKTAPFTARLHAAMAADGSTIRPPELGAGIKTKGYRAYGIVPHNLRGLTAFHHETRTAVNGMLDEAMRISADCLKGNCACKAGTFDVVKFADELALLTGDLTKIDGILLPELAPALNGLDLNFTQYVIGDDWSIKAPADAMRKQNPLAMFSEMLFGDAAGRSPFGRGRRERNDDMMVEVIEIGGMRGGGSPFGGATTLRDLLGRLRGSRRHDQYAGSA